LADSSQASPEIQEVPWVDSSELARTFFTPAGSSVQPCVRPFGAVHMTAGHNALRRSGLNPKHAFDIVAPTSPCTHKTPSHGRLLANRTLSRHRRMTE